MYIGGGAAAENLEVRHMELDDAVLGQILRDFERPGCPGGSLGLEHVAWCCRVGHVHKHVSV
jgi:hypothetical protein